MTIRGHTIRGTMYSKRKHRGAIVARVLAVIAGLLIITGVFGFTGSSNDDVATETDALVTQQLRLPGQSETAERALPSTAATPTTSDDANPTANALPVPAHRADIAELIAPEKTDLAALTTGTTAAPEATRPARPMNVWQVSKGDTMSAIFSHFNIYSDLHPLMQLDDAKTHLRSIRPGDKIELDIDASGLKQLVYEITPIKRLVIDKSDEQGFLASFDERETEINEVHAHGVITDSLFASASRAGLSDNLIMQMADIFGYDIDFVLDIRQGDSFKMIYEEVWLDGEQLNSGNIVAAEFVNQGKTFRAIRYTNPEGETEYYSPEGRNMKKEFLRTPVNFTRISSRYNPKRKHPILHTIRAHKGVDYAAPRGTPIKAAGNGKIVHRGTKGGYGKTVIIQHGNKYSTLYAHMNNYRKGQRVGSTVKQGDIVGYVGSSGLATGPHLHYEFHVYGRHKNPLTVDLPKAKPLPSHLLDDFSVASAPYVDWLNSLSRVASTSDDRHLARTVE